jgi:hypothetical protein
VTTILPPASGTSVNKAAQQVTLSGAGESTQALGLLPSIFTRAPKDTHPVASIRIANIRTGMDNMCPQHSKHLKHERLQPAQLVM